MWIVKANVFINKIGPFPAFFIYFHLFNTVEYSRYIQYLLMTGLEPRTSGVGRNRSTNWVTTTAHKRQLFICQNMLLRWNLNNAGIKSLPVINYSESIQIFGLLLYRNLSPRTFKNRPIWSHWWPGYSGLPALKIAYFARFIKHWM